MKQLISIFLVLILSTSITCFAMSQEEKETQLFEYQNQINECIEYKDKLHSIAEACRSIGLHDTANQMSDLWFDKHNEQLGIQTKYDELQATNVLYYADWQYNQYPYACLVWQRLREAGYNEYVSAGILGNMMAECGGQTLALQPFLYSHGYYGLCMWSLRYGASVGGRDLKGQMDYLFATIQKNMNYFGGSNCYNNFLSLTNEQTAASWFQKYYERGSGGYVRAANATKALNYFRQI